MNRTIVICLLGVLILNAAEDKAFEFHGSASIEPEYTYRNPNGAQIEHEPFGWNFRFRPKMKFWGMPLNLNFLLSSYEVDFRQPFNRFKFSLPSLSMPDLKFNAPWLELQLVDANPTYSAFSIEGMNVRGGAVDLKPGKFRLSVTGGQVQRGIVSSDTTDVAYLRWLYAGRLGWGKEEESHLHFHYLKAWDDSTSISDNTEIVTDSLYTDTVQVDYPEENAVATLEGKVALLDGKLSFDGELAGSAFSRNTESSEIDNEYVNWIPEFIFTPRWSSQVGWAGRLGTELSIDNTEVELELEQVNWGFESAGITSLDQDTRTVRASFSQFFIKPFPISCMGSADIARNNLDGMDFETTRYNMGFVYLGLFPQKAPDLSLTYVPYFSKTDDEGILVSDYRMHSIIANSSYNFEMGERPQRLSLNLTLSSDKDEINADTGSFSVDVGAIVNHELLDNLTLFWNAGEKSTIDSDDEISHKYLGGLGYTLLLWDRRWRTTARVDFQTAVNRPEDRLFANLSSSIEVFEGFDVKLTTRFTTYHSKDDEDDYTEFLGRAELSYNW
ncbi:hypothetical protein GF359_01645 [candidate division WOR-3 bacterium]|uniref:Uncharacterized protein n=1 Tax=candidate division WOR-3 bacterium TaxID=2052148 RepID=A0A9D5QCC8_UNCW3|nr:hypothetical protein [candidate division WOR-3 bacterium]MBD3363897.1 hypothetical protein [candidate division WOR-3 bacterium]